MCLVQDLAQYYATLGGKRKVDSWLFITVHCHTLKNTPYFSWYLCEAIDPHSGI